MTPYLQRLMFACLAVVLLFTVVFVFVPRPFESIGMDGSRLRDLDLAAGLAAAAAAAVFAWRERRGPNRIE